MKKRVLSFILATVMVWAAGSQLALQVRADAYFVDPQQVSGASFSNVYAAKLNRVFRGEVALFSNTDKKFPIGSSLNNNTVYGIADNLISGYQCYIYAQAVYYYLFGDVIYHGDGYKYWSDSAKVLTNKKTVSYDMFRDAGVGFGAYIRTTGNSNGSYSSSIGHSLIVLGYNGEGITYLEGNADGKGLIRVSFKTWDEFNKTLLTAKSRRICHVVQCISARCEHLEYTDQGVCVDCGLDFDYSVTLQMDCMGYYTVSAQDGAMWNPEKPYPAQDAVLLPEGELVEVLGQVSNAFGQTWYKISWEDMVGYVPVETLTWQEYAPQQITGVLRSPQEGITLPQASYPVEGTVTSKYPLGEVVGELDGMVYATVTPSNTTTLEIQSTAINRDLSFAALEPGEHTLVIKARDIHREEYITLCTRMFTIRETETSAEEPDEIKLLISRNASSGKPVLSWDKVENATKYEVYRATSENGKYKKLTTVTKLTYTDTKAAAGTMYYYKIRVIGNSKCAFNKKYSGIAACWTACAQPTVTGSNDAATGSPKLSWKAVTGAVGYRIYRSLTGEAFELLGEQTGKSYIDKTAPVDTLCIYRVQAVGRQAALDSAYTKKVPVTAACARTSLKADILDDGSGIISWQPVEGAISYRLYRSTKSGKSYQQIRTIEETSYVDPALTAGKVYYYKVVAVGKNSKSAYSSYVKATGRCAAPSLSAEENASGKPVLSWDKVTGAKKYEIQRSVDGGAFKKVATTTKRTYTDTKATAGAVCAYRVRALGSKTAYNSVFSQEVSLNVACTTPVVTGKTDAATGKPSLSWKKAAGALSYEIYRSVDEGEYEYLTETTGTAFLDRQVQIAQDCSYKVIAIGREEVFNSTESKPVQITPVCPRPAAKGLIDASGKPTVTWEGVEGATGYAVWRSTSKTKGYKKLIETDDTQYTDTTAKKNKTYYYKVTALKESTESAQSGYVKLKAKK